MEEKRNKLTDENKFIYAKFDAYYWWENYENNYHQYFKNIEKYINKNEINTYFLERIFKKFLSDYSIRRNIPAGNEKLEILLKILLDNDFFYKVKNENFEFIDLVNKNYIDQMSIINDKKTRSIISLLSKLASLINPSVFSMYDTLARTSLKQVLPKHKVENYETYLLGVNELLKEKSSHLKKVYNDAEHYKFLIAEKFFRKSELAFNRRVIDKYLVLYNNESMSILNDYKRIIN